MGRNLYILGGTLLFFSLASFGMSYLQIAREIGSPGDVSMWRLMATAFLVLGMVVALVGSLSSLFEQAERRAEEARQVRRKKPGR